MVDGVMAKDADKAGKRFPSELHRKQRNKNRVLMLALIGFAVLVYFVAIVRMGAGG